MELDDLKQTWQQSQSKKPLNTNIMELIQHKSYGPLATLKKSFLKHILFMTIWPAYIIIDNLDDLNLAFMNPLFWVFIAFSLGIIVFTYYNYQIVSKMESMDNLVKVNLEQQVDLLQTRMKWKKTALVITLVFFIGLLEIVPYFEHYRMLDKWHAVAPAIRFLCYAAFMVLQHFLGAWVNERRFGRHLKYLKELADEMQ